MTGSSRQQIRVRGNAVRSGCPPQGQGGTGGSLLPGRDSGGRRAAGIERMARQTFGPTVLNAEAGLPCCRLTYSAWLPTTRSIAAPADRESGPDPQRWGPTGRLPLHSPHLPPPAGERRGGDRGAPPLASQYDNVSPFVR